MAREDNNEHRPYEDFAVRHVMGSLDEAEAGAFRSHLLECAECRARVGELRSIASDLAEVERAERRERAARLVDTKEREDDEIESDYADRPGRNTRFVALAGVLLVITLSIWNFVLRDQKEALADYARSLQDATATANFGDEWDIEIISTGREAVVRAEDGAIAVMVRGTHDDQEYLVRVLGEDGLTLDQVPVESVNGQLRYYNAVDAVAAQIDVLVLRGVGAETVVLRATP